MDCDTMALLALWSMTVRKMTIAAIICKSLGVVRLCALPQDSSMKLFEKQVGAVPSRTQPPLLACFFAYGSGGLGLAFAFK